MKRSTFKAKNGSPEGADPGAKRQIGADANIFFVVSYLGIRWGNAVELCQCGHR
jgi:hypothetical protein